MRYLPPRAYLQYTTRQGLFHLPTAESILFSLQPSSAYNQDPAGSILLPIPSKFLFFLSLCSILCLALLVATIANSAVLPRKKKSWVYSILTWSGFNAQRVGPTSLERSSRKNTATAATAVGKAGNRVGVVVAAEVGGASKYFFVIFNSRLEDGVDARKRRRRPLWCCYRRAVLQIETTTYHHFGGGGLGERETTTKIRHFQRRCCWNKVFPGDFFNDWKKKKKIRNSLFMFYGYAHGTLVHGFYDCD